MSVFEQWKISSSRGTCSACDVEFLEGGIFYSGLRDGEEGLARCDFCRDCWADADRDGLFCHWRTRREKADEKPRVDTDLLVEFFRRLTSADTPEKQAFRFVLALYLLRRKVLNLRQTTHGGDGDFLLLEWASSGDAVKVADPGLTEEQIESAAARLSGLFDAEL